MSSRANLAVLVAFLVGISLVGPRLLGLLAALALIIAMAARLPVPKLLLRAAAVLPLAGLLALAAHSFTLLAKSYLSIFAVLVFNALTPVPAWTEALYAWRFPASLILTLQFVYRYMFVIVEEARRMRLAARNRGGFRFDSAAGAIGVLFARSWRRSETIHQAMIARGFRGRFT